jgi:hypothetical protein
VAAFKVHATALAGSVGTAVHTQFLEKDHSASNRDGALETVEGIIVQCAAEMLAMFVSVANDAPPLTTFHQVRALYDAHAMAHWLFAGDFEPRARQVQKRRLKERAQLEELLAARGWRGESAVTEEGRAFLADKALTMAPAVDQRIRGSALLQWDYAYVYKYGSAHTHPYHMSSDTVDPDTERTTVEQLLAAGVRHCAATYRAVVSHFDLKVPADAEAGLATAEAWSGYPFDLPAADTYK